MKLLIAIVQDADANFLMDSLTEKRYRVTKLATTGGFLREGNTTLLIGIEEENLEEVKKIIEDNCKKRTTQSSVINPTADSPLLATSAPVDVNVGGATVFILDVDQYIRI
ncbi:MAG: cyclic-di-AMP receptor [Anaerococcus hydrogenalis]|uniref:cyclic-di-AMP receptor n=1 Tax=Anaerococcus TaxID=165779 RepID=UPI0002F292F5|nr:MULTISPECIES: cyclic-di-AMP receptor [Anaerococcus]MDU1316925.1 cyclic-di-AMP receptor [Anaerococcus hydrogenalis]MDU2201627.1 cyclic-di-AMP receptor [Anaerococcus hydrogenalis]MDU2583267.1 cyclic-di-AMP receptor [Anaerococcus hydrogenalis]MDU3688156.1 cyclic-di-AMP receptor [Anaerococcus hydrogenalis]